VFLTVLMRNFFMYAAVAQVVEHLIGNEEVSGSSPLSSFIVKSRVVAVLTALFLCPFL
jgi:hypothetical protein